MHLRHAATTAAALAVICAATTSAAGEGPLGIVLEDVTAPTTGGLPQAAANAWSLTSDVVTQIAALPGHSR